MLNIQLNINENLKNQFVHYFKLKEKGGEYFLDPKIGSGKGMKFIEFPGKLEFYHFKKSFFNSPVYMKSINPVDSEWFLIHINLSKNKQEKKIENTLIEFQKHLPIGLLLYGLGLEIDTQLPANIEMELATIHFHRSILDVYFEDWSNVVDSNKNIVSEDLDFKLENALHKALNTLQNKIDCHANVLKFMDLFFEKLSAHSKQSTYKSLHSDDVNKLFLASAHLRNPLSKNIPTIKDLASFSNMGITKFKTSFKQLFGSAPIQYRNKIRMEYAREEIISKRKTPSEISHVLGYSHPSNFTAAYKKYFKELPSSTT